MAEGGDDTREKLAECSIVKAVLDLVGSDAFAAVLIKVSSVYKFAHLVV